MINDGNDYTAAQAAKVLNRSVKRVRQMIVEGKLEQVPDSEPKRVTAQSVHELRDTLRSQGAKPGRSTGTPTTGLTYEQVLAMVETLTAPTLKALETVQAERVAIESERRQVEEALRATLAEQAATITQLEQQLAQPTTTPKRRGLFRRS